jgi:hypothetical protein
MSSSATIPQTLTTMEAGFTLSPGIEEEFWRHQDRMGPIAAAAPGFLGVIGGPIAGSPWMYFCGKWQSPQLMDQWYQDSKHRPMMDAAHSRWFAACYIRKWRRPQAGEPVEGRVFCETSIACDTAPAGDRVERLLREIGDALPGFAPLRFETFSGEYEKQPYQFVGPLMEFPQLAPVRYLLLTHWDSVRKAETWLASATMRKVAEIGEISSDIMVPIVHATSEREGLTTDGTHRQFGQSPVG